MSLFLALTACGPGSTWVNGTWTLTEWSVTVGDPAAPSLQSTLTDAGTLTFSGSGEWWESDLLYEGPDVIDLGGAYEVIDQSAWSYWALQDGEIWIAWIQDYSQPEVLVPDSPRASSFRATSTRQLVAVGAFIPVTTDWTLTREAP